MAFAFGGEALEDLQRLAARTSAPRGESAVVNELARLLLARGGRGAPQLPHGTCGGKPAGERGEEAKAGLARPFSAPDPEPQLRSPGQLQSPGVPGLGAAVAAAAAAARERVLGGGVEVVER